MQNLSTTHYHRQLKSTLYSAPKQFIWWVKITKWITNNILQAFMYKPHFCWYTGSSEHWDNSNFFLFKTIKIVGEAFTQLFRSLCTEINNRLYLPQSIGLISIARDNMRFHSHYSWKDSHFCCVYFIWPDFCMPNKFRAEKYLDLILLYALVSPNYTFIVLNHSSWPDGPYFARTISNL